MLELKLIHVTVNSLWPSDAIWWQRSGSTMAQVMACCLTAPSHYLNQCSVSKKLAWFIRHLSDGLYIFHINLWNLPSDIWAYIYSHRKCPMCPMFFAYTANVDLSSVRSLGIHLRVISQEIPQPSISKINLKLTYLKFHLNLSGANELIKGVSGALTGDTRSQLNQRAWYYPNPRYTFPGGRPDAACKHPKYSCFCILPLELEVNIGIHKHENSEVLYSNRNKSQKEMSWNSRLQKHGKHANRFHLKKRTG